MVEVNYLDLFSGIGGFALGLQQAGFKFKNHYYSEIDKYAQQIYQKHFPTAKPVGDVSKLTGDELGQIDLITFGFPCQDLSIAGKRRGLEGKRSGLFYEATRLIDRLKPRYFIFENVKGLFSSDRGKDFVRVLREITDIGYDGEWQLLNTRWFLPQNRERIYFVGHPRGGRRPEIFPIGEGCREVDEVRELGIRISNSSEREFKWQEHSPCLSARDYKEPKLLKQIGTIGKDSMASRVYDTDGCSTSIRAVGGGGGAKTGLYCVAQRGREGGQQIEKRDDADEYTNTLTDVQKDNLIADTGNCQAVEIKRAPLKYMKRNQKNIEGDYTFTIDDANTGGISEGSRIRRLTPAECERLQGFPNGWTADCSDTQRYRQLGNAVSVPVVKAIGERLHDHLI